MGVYPGSAMPRLTGMIEGWTCVACGRGVGATLELAGWRGVRWDWRGYLDVVRFNTYAL